MVEKHFAELVGRGGGPKARACRLLNLYISLGELARRHFAQLLDSKNKCVLPVSQGVLANRTIGFHGDLAF